jgi:hypothetical protein
MWQGNNWQRHNLEQFYGKRHIEQVAGEFLVTSQH